MSKTKPCLTRPFALALLTGVSAFALPALSGARAAVDEIVVTAQKREQDILEVGATVTALGAVELRERRIEQVSEFVSQLVNVDIKENSPGILPVITIRGVGLNDFSATNNPAAGVYVDEVYLSSLALLNADLFDIERMEALKGPQGTLYGRNSTAGAINIISARPTLEGHSGRAALGYGNFETFDAEAMLNTPLSDSFALRFSGKAIDRGEGIYDNRRTGDDVGRRDVLLGRAQALWRVTPVFDALLKLEGQRVRSEVGAGEFFGAVPVPGVDCPGSPACEDFLGTSDTDGDPFRIGQSVDPTYDVDQWSATLRLEADLGRAMLTSITGFIDFEREWGADTDATVLRQTDFIEYDDIQQLSQELRLAGETAKFTWVGGVFFSHDAVEGRYDGDLRDLFNTTTVSTWDQTSKSAAAFGQVEYALTERLSLVAGLRYTWEEKENSAATVDLVSEAPGSALSLQPFGSPPVTLASVDDAIDDTSWSWKGGLNWRVSPDTLVYGQVSRGTKSGGFFSGVATNSGQLQPYDPEALIAYEAGLKHRADQFRFEGAVFYYDYSDVQTFIRDTSGGLPIQRLGNVEEATLYGADLSLTLTPEFIPGLTVSAALGLLESELGAFTASFGPVPAGNELPNAPQVTATLAAQYSVSLGGAWGARLRADTRYVDEMEKDSINDPLIATESYWVTNARAALTHADGWEVAVWAKNLLDEEYVTQGVNQLALGYGYRVYGAPQTFGVTLARSF